MPKKNGNYGTPGVGDAWAWAGEMTATHGCAVRIVMSTHIRDGHWNLRAEAVDVVDGRAVGVRAKVERVYDGWMGSESLGQALYGLLARLDRELSTDPLTGARTP